MTSPTSVSPSPARSRRLRFSLRVLLWLFVGATILLGVVGIEVRRWAKDCDIERQLQQGHGGLARQSMFLTGEQKPWLATLSPYFDPVDHITVHDASAELINELSRFKQIRSLWVERLNDPAMAALRFDVFPTLNQVTIMGNYIDSDEEFVRLANDLTTLLRTPRLRSVSIHQCALNESQLATIARIATLDELDLSECRLPINWAKAVGSMTSLKKLTTTAKAAAADVEQFSQCRTLQVVYYDATPHVPYRRGLMDDDAVRAFYKVLPHARLRTQYGDLVPPLDDAE